ncbi:hypothetical protein Y1Q_0001883 [Alligator mississippiensis]|uniref:Uncharacterized protein n=1 Tax=Alligator mississippiensis TaxID=8496 RepID=A0A151PGN8_ALLMI|nr:hypothetical protein Y1Q_0001883 [Alligator mississippiensis]
MICLPSDGISFPGNNTQPGDQPSIYSESQKNSSGEAMRQSYKMCPGFWHNMSLWGTCLVIKPAKPEGKEGHVPAPPPATGCFA